MQKHSRKLLVVIAEAAIERVLIADARRLGAQGYTVSEVRGGGVHGDHEAEWDVDRSIELKLVCSVDVADRIAAHVLESYAKHYRIVVFLTDVEVFRAEKF